jgi:putative hydrolase of the HAD superfamily
VTPLDLPPHPQPLSPKGERGGRLPAIRAVFLDAVGTLIHPEPPAPVVYAAVARRFGSRLDTAAIAPRFAAAFARQEALDCAAGLRTSEERELARWRAIVGAVLDDVSDPESCFQELYAHFAAAGAWRCQPGTQEVLEGLAARGCAVGIASNFDHRLRGVAAGLAELRPARHLVISSEVGWRKPAPAFFAAVCAAVGRDAAEVLFVGDDFANDYEGALAAGLRALLLDPGSRSPVSAAQRVLTLGDLLPCFPHPPAA